MKKLKLSFIFASILTAALTFQVANAGLAEFFEHKEFPKNYRDEIANLDVNFSASLGSLELINGINLSTKYRYEVESSYIDQYFTRLDKWDLNVEIKPGDVIKNFEDTPFSFSIDKKNSFLFVRQFKSKKEAIKALPYTPKRLPLSGESALKNLNTGDFVSMPATLNIAISAGASTTTVSPVVLTAATNAYWILSGEFNIQVFKLDDSHVRLKLISGRGDARGVSADAGLSFKIFGVNILDRQVDRLFDRDLIQLGYSMTPGSQFIVDYIFDLKDENAREAYDQILKTTFKFSDVVVLNKLDGSRGLKDKLISSYEKADKLFAEDKIRDSKDRRVSRIFKGFSDYKTYAKHLKLALLLTSFKKDSTYAESKVTYIDKNENNLEFLYPTYSKFMETKIGKGKWYFDFKDQIFQNNFGLIPRRNSEDTKTRTPDLGLTFERIDKFFSSAEQKHVRKFMMSQIPPQISEKLDIPEWKNDKTKTDSRINFQLILKAEGFNYLRAYSQKDLRERLLKYTSEKKKEQSLDSPDSKWSRLKNFLFIKRFTKKGRLEMLADQIHSIIQNEINDTEIMTRKLVELNKHGIYDRIGVGFLISLLPQEKLIDLIYLKISMTARDIKAINYEFGNLKYRALYNELDQAQSRISGRGYDLRVTNQDHQMEDIEVTPEKSLYDTLDEDILGLN